MSLILIGFGCLMFLYAGVLLYLGWRHLDRHDVTRYWLIARASCRVAAGGMAVLGAFAGGTRAPFLALGILLVTDSAVIPRLARHYLPNDS